MNYIMRPEKAYRIVNKAMANFYTVNENFDVLLNKKFVRALDKCLEKSISDERKYHEVYLYGPYLETENYYPAAYDTNETIANTLFYISDRWNCTGRMKYIKNLITKLYRKNKL